MASEERSPAADPAMTLDEVAPRRRDTHPRAGAGHSRRRAMVLAGLVLGAVLATAATVAAVTGPAPDRGVDPGVARSTDVSPTAPIAEGPATTLGTPSTSAAPQAEAADNADIATTDCADDDMCGDIAPEGPCDDADMCGDIRTDDDCADGEMCGDIPAPSTCADPTMCGAIVPQPVDPGG